MKSIVFDLFLILSFTLAIIVPFATANIAEWDDLWLERAKEAEAHALKAYTPHPENVTRELVKAVHETIKASFVLPTNGTRRQLGKRYDGPCKATNPIDRCWRCDPNWASNRKRLADCAMGFGRNAIGGKYGEFYEVTDPSDDPVHPQPGTLRYAVIQKRPLWITFKHDMIIKLQQELIMTSYKTIDGRGARVFIRGGAGFMIQLINNVIIHGIRISHVGERSGGIIADWEGHLGLRQKSDGDGIQIYGSSDIWIDHVSMKKCYDGLIDVVAGSTAVTISNGHFTDHDEVMLMGASNVTPIDKRMQVTLAFNHFGKRLMQRMPRCRFGYFHVINNDYTHWQKYAIGGSMNPTIISQGNRFIAPDDVRLKEVTKRQFAYESEWKHWTWRSEGDLFMNGAYFVQSGDDPEWISKHEEYVYADGVHPAPGTLVTQITRFAGSLNCLVGKAC